MSTFLVYDKVTENHWGVKYRPPPRQPSAAPKTPAAVQKVHGVGCLPFNETIKGPVSPSIDFSHSFSDKFELIIQHQAPGDVYFQHEGQLIHRVSFPPCCLSLSLSLVRSLVLHPTHPLSFLFIRLHSLLMPAGRVLTKEECATYIPRLLLISLFSVGFFLFLVKLTALFT